MFCPKCGNSLKEGTRFCTECGTDVALAQVAETISTAESEIPAVPVEPAISVPPKSSVIHQTPAPPTAPVQKPPSQPQPAYTAPSTPQPNPALLDKPLSIWQYLGMFILTAIPIVGIVMIFMWAFGKSVNKNKKNYARALLVMFVLGIVLSVIISITFGSVLTAFFKFTTFIPVE